MADHAPDPPAAPEQAPSPPGSARRRLPPPSRWQVAALVVAACFLAGAAGWTFAQDRPPSRASADVGFLYDMSSHHEGAITLSAIVADRGTDPDVAAFASEITLFQAYEIGLMDAWLDQWGYAREDRDPLAMRWMGHEEVPVGDMPGMASEAQLEALRDASGPEADALFVALMVEHHRAGAEMAEAAAGSVDDAYVRDLAERMARYQRLEIQEMEAARERNGLPVVEVAAATHGDHG